MLFFSMMDTMVSVLKYKYHQGPFSISVLERA